MMRIIAEGIPVDASGTVANANLSRTKPREVMGEGMEDIIVMVMDEASVTVTDDAIATEDATDEAMEKKPKMKRFLPVEKPDPKDAVKLVEKTILVKLQEKNGGAGGIAFLGTS